MSKKRELRAKWKPRKKKGGFCMKWTFKKREVASVKKPDQDNQIG